MKIVVSPAKSLDFSSKLPTSRHTQPQFLEEAKKLNGILAKKTKPQLKDLMGISDKLAELNYQRYKEFTTPITPENARPAIFAFSGDVYAGFDAYSFPVEKLEALQNSLRILSGMYGLLRPLDLMQPYRLEMGIDLRIGTKKNLYEFWQKKITETLNQELEEGELFLNLASKEYFSTVNPKKLKTPIISPVFKDYKNGKLKIISFYAKKARGAMARFAIENEVTEKKDILAFNTDGYAFSAAETQKENEPVFIR